MIWEVATEAELERAMYLAQKGDQIRPKPGVWFNALRDIPPGVIALNVTSVENDG